MIQITPHMKIFLATKAVDFRKGIDGLASVCRGILNQDPFSGYLFVFRNCKNTSIKILFYDGQGFWLFLKRLSKGKLKWWPKNKEEVETIAVNQLQVLLWNGDLRQVDSPVLWRPLPGQKE